jgi:hypothetical protein
MDSTLNADVVKKTLYVEHDDGTGVACLNGPLDGVDQGERCVSGTTVVARAEL